MRTAREPDTFTVAEIESAMVKLAADGVTVTDGVVGFDGGGVLLPPPPPHPPNRRLSPLATMSVNVPHLPVMFFTFKMAFTCPESNRRDGFFHRHATDTTIPNRENRIALAAFLREEN